MVGHMLCQHTNIWNLFSIHLTYLFQLQTFKIEIEKPNQYNGPILAAQEIKLIFGNIPPIYEVHCKIRDRLIQTVENWKEDVCVGDIFIEHVSTFIYVYMLKLVYLLTSQHRQINSIYIINRPILYVAMIIW